MRSIKHKCIILSAFLLGLPAQAARFPNAVEKKMQFNGDAAAAIADIFELTQNTEHKVSLRLGRGDAWAIYLLKQDTKEPLLNDNDGSPARFNEVEYLETPKKSIIISPFWLDLGTRAPSPKPGYFSFSSPFIAASSAKNTEEPWARILQQLKKDPHWKEDNQYCFQQSYTFNDDSEISLQAMPSQDYATNKKGYIVILTAKAK